jgi:hypothetical protein
VQNNGAKKNTGAGYPKNTQHGTWLQKKNENMAKNLNSSSVKRPKSFNTVALKRLS